MRYDRQDGTWIVAKEATGIHDLKELLTVEDYASQRDALQDFLCEYFSLGKCVDKQGSSISPIGSSPKGGKVLKVRWALPGCGKSGGLRLCIVAYCNDKRVVVADAFLRRDNPTDGDFERAVKNL